MLMPASDDSKRDREIFLKILTMDDEGALVRWRDDKRFSVSELGVLATQDSSGAWHTVMNNPSTYLEMSATAAFAAQKYIEQLR